MAPFLIYLQEIERRSPPNLDTQKRRALDLLGGVDPLVAYVVRSEHVRADVFSVLNTWSTNDMLTALRIADFYDELARIAHDEAERERERGRGGF